MNTRFTPGAYEHLGQAALMRLQLWFTGETHARLAELGRKSRAALLNAAGADGALTEADGQRASVRILRLWEAYFRDWKRLFYQTREQAAGISFGALAALHEHYVKPSPPKAVGASPGPVFEPQLPRVLDAAADRLYGDGFKLSGRIWNLDQKSRQGIQDTIMAGIKDGKSAWELAGDLEKYLGAGKDCPRWTSTRLYRLTKKDIASGDRRGLLTGEDCDGRGVAYNALRLARNEIQIAHHMANDLALKNSPWAVAEQIYLSPSHPPIGCECEQIVVGGENGDGVYPVGTISLPVHPQCLCGKMTIMREPEAFAAELSAWADGAPDAGLDDYARFLGIDLAAPGVERGDVLALSLLASKFFEWLLVWLFGSTSEIAGLFGGEGET